MSDAGVRSAHPPPRKKQELRTTNQYSYSLGSWLSVLGFRFYVWRGKPMVGDGDRLENGGAQALYVRSVPLPPVTRCGVAWSTSRVRIAVIARSNRATSTREEPRTKNRAPRAKNRELRTNAATSMLSSRFWVPSSRCSVWKGKPNE